MGSRKIDSVDLKILYNFTYRLSGNSEVAQSLTEQVLLLYVHKPMDKVTLLKCAWEKFLHINKEFLPSKHDLKQNILSFIAPELRCAVILRDIFGYSYEQIGTVLNKPKQEVASFVSLGRQGIRKIVS